jgi:GWxTD domain-containing protein
MKQFLFSIIFLSLFSLTASAQEQLEANVVYNTFKGANQNYIEINFHIKGGSVHYKTNGVETKAAIETVVLFKQNDKIIKFDKFTLNSPPLKKDTVIQVNDFTHLKRYALENGDYDVEITLNDVNNADTSTLSLNHQFSILHTNDDLSISDLQLIDGYSKTTDAKHPFAKNGFIFDMHPTNFYGYDYKLVKFYTEIYNTDKIDGAFYIRYFIQKKGVTGEAKPLQMRAKKLAAKPIHAMILQLGISQIPDGNYELVFEIRDANHKILANKVVPFKRSNPFLDRKYEDYASIAYENTFIDELDNAQIQYSIRALKPLLVEGQVVLHNEIIKSTNTINKKKFLLNYWIYKDAQKPEKAFQEYMNLAQKVDKQFRSSMSLGFETDRGFTYIKHGKPNDIIRELSDPTAPPYEIWKYFELEQQQDVRFVFANPTLAVNDFKLIHSTLRGEHNNPNWLRDLYEKSPIKGGNYLDNPKPDDQMGRNAESRADQ